MLSVYPRFIPCHSGKPVRSATSTLPQETLGTRIADTTVSEIIESGTPAQM